MLRLLLSVSIRSLQQLPKPVFLFRSPGFAFHKSSSNYPNAVTLMSKLKAEIPVIVFATYPEPKPRSTNSTVPGTLSKGKKRKIKC